MAGDATSNIPDFAADLLRDAPCGIAVTDTNGRLLYVNETLAGWVGLSAEHAVGALSLSDLLTTPGRLFHETHMAPMMRLQGFVREISCQLRVAGAEPLPVMLSGVARLDAKRRPARFDYTFFDARERHGYEEELRTARRKADELAAIVRTSPNAILRVDSRGVVKSWNRGAELLLARTAEDTLQRPVDAAVVLRDRQDWFAEALREGAGEKEVVFEAVHESGVELEITIAPIGDPNLPAAARDNSLVLRDISSRKRAERHLRVMVDEMNHRVKNTLGVVAGIARQTLRPEDSKALIARLHALSRAHDALTQTQWTEVDLRELLRFAAEEAGGSERLQFSGPAAMLSPRQATSLSMAFHELVTNALKYGALSAPEGHIRVEYGFRPGRSVDRLWIDWRESGGPVVSRPTREGFGTRMIKSVLASDLEATVSFDFPPEGLRCELEFTPE